MTKINFAIPICFALFLVGCQQGSQIIGSSQKAEIVDTAQSITKLTGKIVRMRREVGGGFTISNWDYKSTPIFLIDKIGKISEKHDILSQGQVDENGLFSMELPTETSFGKTNSGPLNSLIFTLPETCRNQIRAKNTQTNFIENAIRSYKDLDVNIKGQGLKTVHLPRSYSSLEKSSLQPYTTDSRIQVGTFLIDSNKANTIIAQGNCSTISNGKVIMYDYEYNIKTNKGWSKLVITEARSLDMNGQEVIKITMKTSEFPKDLNYILIDRW